MRSPARPSRRRVPGRRSLLGGLGAAAIALAAAGCGSGHLLQHLHGGGNSAAQIPSPTPLSSSSGDSTAQQLGVPYVVTKNTTRIAGSDPISDAAAVALTVYPSTIAGSHPPAVVLAPTDDPLGALAASSLMGAPFNAPELLSTSGTLPKATAAALQQLAPVGEAATRDAQVIRIGDVPVPAGYKTTSITQSDPYAAAAAIDAYEAKLRGRESIDVVIASGQQAAWAMPAAGWAAESGEPILYVTSKSIPAATATALKRHPHAHIYVLGPSSVISDSVLTSLGAYGSVNRISAATPADLSVAFAEYRDPACPYHQPCAHIPGSFGWAINTPGHGYVFLNEDQPLDAGAAAALSASGAYGPSLLLESATTLPQSVLTYVVQNAKPGYGPEGPTAEVFDRAWLIGDVSQISLAVQTIIDSQLEMVPVANPNG